MGVQVYKALNHKFATILLAINSISIFVLLCSLLMIPWRSLQIFLFLLEPRKVLIDDMESVWCLLFAVPLSLSLSRVFSRVKQVAHVDGFGTFFFH